MISLSLVSVLLHEKQSKGQDNMEFGRKISGQYGCGFTNFVPRVDDTWHDTDQIIFKRYHFQRLRNITRLVQDPLNIYR